MGPPAPRHIKLLAVPVRYLASPAAPGRALHSELSSKMLPNTRWAAAAVNNGEKWSSLLAGGTGGGASVSEY